MLVRKVDIFGVLALFMMFSFGEMLLLDPSAKIYMRHIRVGMYRQPLMMIYPFYYISDPVP